MSQHDRRGYDRKKRRIPCTLWVGTREHNALVLDLSPSGLFIQTHAKTQRGERLRIRIHESTVMELEVEVARTKHVPPNLLAATKGGIGVRVVSAPEEYYQLLAELGISDGTRTLELEPEPGLRYRVHVAQTGGPRSRRVEVAASDEDAARVRVLEELGDGWKVLRVELV
jgi:hypothetical protein